MLDGFRNDMADFKVCLYREPLFTKQQNERALFSNQAVG